ncbi:MAG: biopolymer transporter ExbD [Prevotellaceae bacterium]|jgi:biopolymer transport protein ExbD|nr:biopolymer transporter ExbD [Prevotellaceae bacterium]
MAEINTGGGEAKKGKPKKQNLRVDFTPMVDMNMLLITFFMFVTTLSKPQMMNLVMPTKDVPIEKERQSKVDKNKTVTIILGANDVAYYYFGEPKYEDYNSLIASDYSPAGIRAMLTERNSKVLINMIELREQKYQEKVTPEQFNERSKEIKDDKEGMVVVIKPTDNATYKNLVDVLDEMQICAIGTYAIVPMTEGDEFLLKNYETKGAAYAETKK